jgi:hypothetical protein
VFGARTPHTVPFNVPTPRCHCRGFDDDGGTEQPARAHEEGTHADNEAIREAEIGGPLPGTLEDQQLLLEEHGFGDHGTGAARTRQSGDGHQQMQKEDGQIAHRAILARSPKSHQTLTNLAS